jgi:hypothetical protein
MSIDKLYAIWWRARKNAGQEGLIDANFGLYYPSDEGLFAFTDYAQAEQAAAKYALLHDTKVLTWVLVGFCKTCLHRDKGSKFCGKYFENREDDWYCGDYKERK